MSDNVYECMFILDSNRYAKDPGKISGQVNELIEKARGEVLVSRLWVEQKLAFPINGHRKGTYWLAYFRIDGEQITDFNRSCRINDNILRHLVLKVDPRLVDTLVSHARGEPKSAPAADAAPAGDKAAGEKGAGEKAAGESAASETATADAS